MKKRYLFILILIWLAVSGGIYFTASNHKHDHIADTVTDSVMTDTGYLISALDEDGEGVLYRLEYGVITQFLNIDSLRPNIAINAIETNKDSVYVLLKTYDETFKSLPIYGILELDRTLTPVKQSKWNTLAWDGDLFDFEYSDGKLYLTQIDKERKVGYLYAEDVSEFTDYVPFSDDMEEEIGQLKAIDSEAAEEDEFITTFEFRDGRAQLFTNLRPGATNYNEIYSNASNKLLDAGVKFKVWNQMYKRLLIACILLFVLGSVVIVAFPILFHFRNRAVYVFAIWEVIIALLVWLFYLEMNWIVSRLGFLMIFLIASLISFIIFYAQSTDLRMLGAAMKQVNDTGEMPKKPIVLGTDLNYLWSGLADLSRTIKKVNYDRFKTYESYYKFAPKLTQTLLGKDSIMDVNGGDNVDMETSIAFIKSRGSDIHDFFVTPENIQAYKNVMKRCLHLISEYQEQGKGQMVGNNSDLSEMCFLFDKDFHNTTDLGISYEKIIATEGLIDISPLIFIHRLPLKYGVAGDEVQCVQYIASLELSELSLYMNDLYDMGLDVVVTEDVLVNDETNPHTRYIGDLRINTMGGRNIKIYQVLDTMNQKMQLLYDEQLNEFNEGMQLFMNQDFYLARNVFADILKVNPCDGVARWYLFTCEHYLNSDDDDIKFTLNQK